MNDGKFWTVPSLQQGPGYRASPKGPNRSLCRPILGYRKLDIL